MSDWQPIEQFDAKPLGGSWTRMIICGHRDKRWVRFGRYDIYPRRWLYSGTSERSQWAQVEGDAPTHFMEMVEPPKEFESGANAAADSSALSNRSHEEAATEGKCNVAE